MLVPAAPGILCAQGLVVSDLKEDFVAGQRPAGSIRGPRSAIGAQVEALRASAEAWLEREEVPAAARRLELSLDLRYVGQNFELPVPFAVDALPDAAGMRAAFFAAHETAYGYHNPHDPVEVVNFRLTARGRLYRPPPPEAVAGRATAPRPRGRRSVFFAPDEALETPVYQRGGAVAGAGARRARGDRAARCDDAAVPGRPRDGSTAPATS